MAYSGVYVFGDSLVDGGNALKLAQWYGGLPFTDLPDGAPTSELGYFQGRFSNGFTFADLIANKAIGLPTKPIFPYGFEYNGIPISPWTGDPSGTNLNFAYGGAQIRQGEEVVPDLDGQTDIFKDAVDDRPDPDALYIFTIGGNDIRRLAPAAEDPADQASAEDAILECVQQLIHEISQLIAIGVRHILITGIPDVGLIPKYDDEPGQPGYGQLEGEEIARSEAATRYSQLLDQLIQSDVVPALVNALVARGVPRATAEAMVNYVQIMDHQDTLGTVTSSGALSAVLPSLEYLHGLPAGELAANPFAHQDVIFFDRVHPNAQTHALIGAYMQADLTGTDWVETMPLLAADVDHASVGSIGAAGEVDTVSIAMAAGSTYTLQLLGVSSLTPYVLGQIGLAALPPGPILADPSLKLLGPSSVVVGADDDSGAGFDSSLVFSVTSAGTYTLQMLGVGAATGSYVFTASVAGAAMGDNSYTVGSASTLVIEAAGGGSDIVNASVSYVLGAGSEIELLQTTNAKGKGAINLTGNEFDQTLRGNSGANVLEGKGGADEYWGGSGNDRFVLGNSALTGPAEIDRIMDYARGDVIDVTQILSVAASVNVTSGGYLRVTGGGSIQVDLDGGGNGWVTIGTVNGNGAVSVRYLSGGTTRDVSVSRTTSVLAAAVAGAGLAAAPASADTSFAASDTVAGHALLGTASQLSAQVVAVEPLQLLAGDFGAVGMALDLLDASPAWTGIAATDLRATAGFAQAATATPVEFLHGTDAPLPAPAAAAFAAQAVAMPSAEMLQALAAAGAVEHQATAQVGRVLADALAGPGGAAIDTVLDALPAGPYGAGLTAAPGLAEWAPAFAPPHPMTFEALALAHDAAALA